MSWTLLLVAGCTPNVDRFGPARAACGLADGELFAWDVLEDTPDGGAHGLVIPEGCADQLTADLGGDPDDLAEELGFASLGALLASERVGASPPTGIGSVLTGMYWLLGANLGSIEALVEAPGDGGDAFVAETWAEAYRDYAEDFDLDPSDPLAELVYDHVAERFERLTLLPDKAPDQAGAGTRGWAHKLLVPRVQLADTPVDLLSPFDGMATLAHEAEHSSTFAREGHVRCESPRDPELGRVCDRDLTGAFGAGFAVLWAQAQVLAPAACDGDRAAVAAFDELELEVLGAWDDFVMSAVTHSPLAPCDGSSGDRPG